MRGPQKRKRVTEIVEEIAKPLAKSLGLSIWDIKFVKEGSTRYLRVFIDSPKGVTLEDCENMSRALDAPLDEIDPIPFSYCLEVSSPGIERELSNDYHLEKCSGKFVKVKLVRPDEYGNREYSGELGDFDEERIVLKLEEGAEICLNRKNISHIKLKC